MATVAISWPAVLSILAGVASLLLTRWVWQFRDRPGATYWTLVQIFIGLWALSYGFALTTFDPELRRLFEPALWITRSMTPPFILLFALAYTGRDYFTRRRFIAIFVGFWVVASLFYVTNSIHHLAWTDYHVDPVFGAAAVDFVPGPGLYFFALTAYLFNGTAAVLVLGAMISYRRLFARQATVLGIILLLPTAANALWLFRPGPVWHLDFTPVLFLVVAAAMSYALFREEMFELLPATTRVANDIAIDDMNTAILTVSPNGRLVDLNAAAAELFGLDRNTALGQSLDEIVDVDIPLESSTFSISNPGGRNREFDVDVSPIESRMERLVGYVVTFYDITEERRRRERLAVQNRILRHNLRNGMAVVDGNAELIGETVEDDRVEGMTATIRETADELVRVGEKIRRFDEALAGDPTDVDIAEICQDVVADVRTDYPRADVAFEGISGGDDAETVTSTRVECRARLLRQVVREAVENGVVHDDDPRVRVGLALASESVTVMVSDEGPGIPDDELDALRSGDEDPLLHGSSIGLWILQWGIGAIGGTATFDVDEHGTTVSLRLPRGRR